jgi:RNA polymerase sigma-70 factor (ECF subfamily)
MALAWQYARSVEDAEDIVQDAFHRAVRALGSYDPRRPFRAWFYAIVRNVARTAIRDNARRAALAPPVELQDEQPDPLARDPTIAGDIERAIERLPPMQQACVRLCDVEGFTSVEAASMLGVSDGTIRTHLSRGRRQLRVAMDSYRGVS